MKRWMKSPRLRFAALGVAAGALMAALSGCPTLLCPNCEIRAAAFEVPSAPSDAEIDQVVVTADAMFIDHCPNSRESEGCDLIETFVSESTSPGQHQVTLEGWPFDDGDEVDVTATVTYRSTGSAPAPAPLMIPSSSIELVVVERGDY